MRTLVRRFKTAAQADHFVQMLSRQHYWEVLDPETAERNLLPESGLKDVGRDVPIPRPVVL
jgi:hypothetical protein